MRNGSGVLALLLVLAGCEEAGRQAPANQSADESVAQSQANVAFEDLPPVEPIPPGKPGGLPNDRTPVSEAPFTPTSAQGAADIVQIYFALLESGKSEQARGLWSDGAGSDAFVRSFADLDRIRSEIGGPGKTEGAAGSLFVEVPVQVYGRSKHSRQPVHRLGTVVLRRVNEVAGAPAEQRQWHISEVRMPSPAPRG